MKTYNDIVFTSSGCLSSSGIEDFVNKTLTGLQQQQAQAHVDSCELCKEAVEGYSLWNAKKSIIAEPAFTYKSKSLNHEKTSEQTPFRHKIEDLNNRVQNRVKVHTEEQNLRRGKKKAMPIGWMAMAASVILLVGLFYRSFFYPSIMDKSVTENIPMVDNSKTSENQETATIIADTVKQIAVVTASRKKPEQTVVIVENNLVIADNSADVDGTVDVLEKAVINDERTSSVDVKTEILAPVVAAETENRPSGEAIPENPFSAKDQVSGLAEARLERKTAVSTKSERSTADVTYVEGIKVSEDEYADEIFQVVEEMPAFPGGDEAYRVFLQNNIRYPVSAKENGLEGTVYLSFEVNKRGKIRDVLVLRGVNIDIDSEAVRVIKMMPDWIPGKQRGKPVDVKMTLPIKFSLK